MNAAKAGAIAALVWAAVEPFDQRMLRHDYSDVAVLGQATGPGVDASPARTLLARLGVIPEYGPYEDLFAGCHELLGNALDRGRIIEAVARPDCFRQVCGKMLCVCTLSELPLWLVRDARIVIAQR
jgi:hypothetical protein